jgi:DNA repair exonuclease SbcCD ATPase subunit
LRLVNDRGGLGNAGALDAARSAIAAQSWLQVQDLEIGRDSATGKLRVGDRLFFNDNTGITGSELSADVINRASVSELMGAMHDSQWDALRKGADYLDSIATLSALDPGADNLTQGEAWRLKAAASVDAKRDRIAAARQASGEALSVAAQDLERAQQALLESAAIEQTYQQAQAAYVQAKHAQVERIEDRLERLIDRQQARLQQTQQSRPGLLAMPGTKRAWQSQQAQQQARLHTLQGRLEAVREIKEGMGLLSPKIEELATRKLRAEHPKLTADWDALQEASRRRQIALRQQAKDHAQTQESRPSRSPSRGFASGNA